MKYAAVFDVPDEWKPNTYDPEASASFELIGEPLLSGGLSLPGDFYQVKRARLKKLPDRIPDEWNTGQAEGFNACLDLLESG